jgi:hypothetical protein
MFVIQTTATIEGDNDFKLVCQATETDTLPLEIFLYRVTTGPTEEYSALCSLYSINTYPTEIQVGSPFVRRNNATLHFTSASLLNEFIATLLVDIRALEIDYGIYISSLHNGETITHEI